MLSVKIYRNLRRNFGFEIYVNKFHAISYMYVREISKMWPYIFPPNCAITLTQNIAIHLAKVLNVKLLDE